MTAATPSPKHVLQLTTKFVDANSVNGVTSIAQARALVPSAKIVDSTDGKQLRRGEVARMVELGLASNVKAGQAYTPLSGFIMIAPGDVALPHGLVNTSLMFKGRVMSPLLDYENDATAKQLMRDQGLEPSRVLERIREKIPVEEMVGILSSVVTKGYASIGGKSLVSNEDDPLVPLMPSEASVGEEDKFSIMQVPGSSALHLVFESHSSLLGGNTPLYQALFDGATSNIGILTILGTERMPHVRLMKRYRKTQIAFRAFVLRKMRATLVEALLGKDAVHTLGLGSDITGQSYSAGNAEAKFGERHFITNEDDVVDNLGCGQFFVFYNETQRAASGALIYGGPFGSSVLANSDGHESESVGKNPLNGAVPFTVPVSSQKLEVDYLYEVARAILVPSEETADTVIIPQLKTDGAGRKIHVATNGEAVLAWPAASVASGIHRYLHRDYFDSPENQDGRFALSLGSYGIDMRMAISNKIVRPLITVMLEPSTLVQLAMTRIYMSVARVEASKKAQDAPAVETRRERIVPESPREPSVDTSSSGEEDEEEEEEEEEEDA